MDEQIPSNVNEPAPATPPANEEATPFSRWMAEYGRPALIGLAVAVVVVLGVSIWRSQKEQKAAAAVQALFQGKSPEELQMLAAGDPEAPTAPLALASAAAEFYAQNRYDEALAAYERFRDLYPAHLLAPDAALGLAASREALEDFEAAATAYEAFAAANPASLLQPQAMMGAARCREQLGQFDAARALYEDFIVAHPDSGWLPQAESGLLFLKKAERAKNMPVPVAPAGEAPAPEAVSEAAPEMLAADEAAPAEEAGIVVEEAASAVDLPKDVPEEPQPNKKTSARKKAAKPADEKPAGNPVPE